jgi:hypothetical protein
MGEFSRRSPQFFAKMEEFFKIREDFLTILVEILGKNPSGFAKNLGFR